MTTELSLNRRSRNVEVVMQATELLVTREKKVADGALETGRKRPDLVIEWQS